MAVVQTRDGGVLGKKRCERWLGSVYVLHGTLQVLLANPSVISQSLFSTGVSLYIWTKKYRRNLSFYPISSLFTGSSPSMCDVYLSIGMSSYKTGIILLP